jgi:uncharacterized phiE125 gp8 family phage protein
MAYKVVTPPAIEPFTTDYVKAWLKIPLSVTVEDDLIADMIISARWWAEQNSNRALLTQTIEEYYDYWPWSVSCLTGVRLSVAPVQSVSSISYMSGGNYVLWNAANYNTDLITEPCRITLKSTGQIPTYDLRTANAIKVVYVAGVTAANLIPGTIKDAMLQRIAFLYENREDIPISQNGSPRLRSASALLQTNRIL